MQILPDRNPVQEAIAKKDASVMKLIEMLYAVIVVGRSENMSFWNQPDEVILGVLNDDVEKTNSTFEANTRLFAFANAFFDELEPEPLNRRFPVRAPVETGRKDLAYNPETGLFYFDKPAESAPAQPAPANPQ